MRHTARPQPASYDATSIPKLRLPLAILLVLALIIAVSGYALFKRLQRNETRRVQENLTSIAQLKSDQITSWLNQNAVDASILAYNSGLSERVNRWLKNGGLADSDAVLLNSRLRELKALYSLGELTITDIRGNPLLSSDPQLPDMSDEQVILRQVMDRKQTVFGELRRDSLPDGQPFISLPMAAPLVSLDGRVIGALWFEYDAQQFLFPLIQKWPVPSDTAETLIARLEDENNFLVLNELRHQNGTALDMRIPSDHPDRLLPRVIRGETGVMPAIDYRGHRVIGYAAPIAGTNWFMVAKVDEDEVYAPVRQTALTIVASALTLLLLSAAMLYLWWRQRAENFRTMQLQSELQQQFRLQQYEFLSQSVNDIVLLIDSDDRIVEVNDRAEQAFGYSRSELIGKHIKDLRSSVSREESERLGNLVKQNKSLVFESRYRRHDGSEFPAEVSARVMERGQQLFIQSIIRDITARKNIENAIRESQERYELVSRATNDIIWDWNLQTGRLEWNEAVKAATGRKRSEMPNTIEDWQQHIHPEDRERVVNGIHHAIENGLESWSDEYRFGPAGGPYRVFFDRGLIARDDEGKPYRMIGSMLDVTERRKAEEALRESETQFRQITESLPQLVFTTLADGHNDYYNARWAEFAGKRPEDVEGEFWAWLLHPEDYPRAVDAWRHSLNTGEPYQIEYRFRSRTGDYRWFLARANPVRNQAGDIVRWFGTCTNITELRHVEEALRESEARARRNEEQLMLAQQAASIGSFVFHIRSNRSEWSPELEALYGLPPGGYDGTYEHWASLVHPDDLEAAEKNLQDAVKGGIFDAEWRVIWPDGSVHWLAGRGQVVRDDETGDSLALVGVNIDVTERKKADARERRLANMYRALGETSNAIIHLESEAELFALICRVAADYGEMAQAWVGSPDEKCNFIPLTSYGKTVDYLKEILQEASISCDPDKPEGNGPAGVAYREGRAVIVNDFVRKVENVTAWMKAARRHGINAAAVLPIKRSGKPYAIFVIYSEQTDSFDDEIVHLLEEIAGNVSFALDNLDRERERRQAEEELRQAALVFHESAEAMMITDRNDHILSVNPSFERLTGYEATEVIGKNPMVLSAGKDRRGHYREMLAKLGQSNYWQGELWLRKKSGEDFAAAMTINTTLDQQGSVSRHVALFTDVTQRKQAEEIVWQQANFDGLTGLPNRRHFLDQLGIEIRKARRNRQPMALLFLDLDGFKYVNDTLGHEVGDMLLKETAERLKRCVRESDTVARLGGDEFTVILGEIRNIRHVEKVARHILHKLAEPFDLAGHVAHVSGSIGITLYPQDASSIDDLLINADHAMYAAKEAGKNRYSFFTAEMQLAAQERAWLMNELRGAIDKRQLRLVYQPIVELSTGCINKAEALLRWDHPERGLIEPAVFIPVAEESGLIQEIGDWVFFEAANQAVKWRQAYHPDFQISINRSPIQFKSRESDMVRWLEELKNLNLPGQAIAVEITEGVLMDESTAVASQLLAFRDAGIEVSLDDFGTGYSSMSYLKRFDIDRLKIDQTFIKDLETNPEDQALCEAMIVMGHKLGLKVIAEGVETDRQREILANAGCDFVQGYLLSTPVSADRLENLLKNSAVYCPGVPNLSA